MGIRIHPLNLSESDYAGECFIESRLALTFMKFRMLFMIMLFVLAPMSGCLSSADEESTKADSIVNGSNSLIKMTDESPGENCAYGGVKIETGIDLDGNEKLGEIEVDNTAYVCNGEPGDNGVCNPEDCCNVDCENQTSSVDQLTGGGWHTCMLREDGTVMCWGNNYYGQIGVGYRNASGGVNPIDVTLYGGHTATQLSAGGFHNCAILDDGSVACWGYNQDGTLGDGTYSDRYVPVPTLSFGPDVTTELLSSGYYHTCALLSDQSISCWGSNEYGQIGNGEIDGTIGISTPYSVPEFSSGSNASLVRAGGHATCVVTTDGELFCWGYKALKGVTNDNSYISTPTHIPHQGTNVTDVSVGGYHTCSLLENGSVMCWGRNDFGQRGLGYTQSATDPFTERAVIDFGNNRTALQVSAGTHHSCAILEDWEIVCWGNNTYGQLGNTPSNHESTPVTVSGLDGVAKPENLFLGNFHTCVVFEDKSVSCWGRNVNGQVGDYTTDDSSEPIFLELD
jgi:alpha-tubulin suppressor-like RCC1 family protein